MRQETRFKFNAYLSRVAELNGIDAGDVSKKFTVEPSVTQTLMNTMQESSDFLTRITGALRAWSRPCSPQIRDWLNWARCCRTAPPSNCPTFRPRPWLKLSICGSNA